MDAVRKANDADIKRLLGRGVAEVIVEEGEVVGAVLDDRWDMLRQKLIKGP